MNATPKQLFNVSAEQAIIGSILIDPESITKLAGDLQPDHFYEPMYAAAYQAMLDQHSRQEGIDIVTVANKLRSAKELEGRDAATLLSDCPLNVVTPSIVDSHARIVKGMAMRRAYLKATRNVAAAANDTGLELSELREITESNLLSIQMDHARERPKPIAHHLTSWHDGYCEIHGLPLNELAKRYVQTGFSCLQKYVHLAPGNVMILAGRTSMGKTALALDIALNVCKQGKTVGFFSYEMTTHEIMDRIVAGRLGVSTKVLQQGGLTDELYAKLGPVLDEVNTYSLYLENNADRSLDTFVSRVRRLQLEHGLDLLVLDYLQLLYTNAKFAQQSRVQMVSHVSNTLKSLAIELQCPVIALAQLSRKTEDRPNKRPQLADLRESGEIEQDADQVVMLYRDGYYNEDCENPNLTDVFIRKNRQGETGHIQLHFDSQRMRFGEVDYRKA